MKPSKPKRPNESQARILRLIAQSWMIRTKEPGKEDTFSTASGYPIPSSIALVLIRNGWVKPHRDSMFDLEPQRYDAIKP